MTLREGLPFELCNQNTASYSRMTNNTISALVGCSFMQRCTILPWSPGRFSGIATMGRKKRRNHDFILPKIPPWFSALAAADVGHHPVGDGGHRFSCFAILSL
jgi:hypothetical protein